MNVAVIRECPLFTKMIDRLEPITAEYASALKSTGIGAVGRYLENLTPGERDSIFSAGLGILPLSEAAVRPLSEEFGKSKAEFLLQRTALLGVPTGAHVMIDLEGQHGTNSDIAAYDEAISDGLASGGYIPLAYIGAGQVLSGAALYALPDVHLYWRGGSLGIPEPSCGFAMWQIPPLEQPVANSIVDVSITGADLRGRKPILWWPS
jgi:hypothetical protein